MPALQALDTGTRFVTLRWREDIIGNQYVIEFRTTSTQTLFNMTEVRPNDVGLTFNPVLLVGSILQVPTGVVEYTLAGLNPSMNYDVRVCRAMQNPSRMDNCGSCLLCVRTSNLDGEREREREREHSLIHVLIITCCLYRTAQCPTHNNGNTIGS